MILPDVCPICGAIIGDPRLHEEWHAAMRELLKRFAERTKPASTASQEV